VTQHRRENHGEPLGRIFDGIRELANSWPLVHFVFPVHPNPSVKGASETSFLTCKNVHLVSPVNYPILIKLIGRSKFVISDSGGIQEEAPILGKTVIVTRDTTERMEAVEAGMAVLVGHDTKQLVAIATEKLAERFQTQPSNLFGDGQTSDRILDLIEKHFDPESSPSFVP
jgi:UDP-N-acetylglucosamine 2-epimerase